MLTAPARAWVGPPHVRRNGVAGVCDQLQRRRRQDLLGEEIGGSNSGRHQKQVVSRAAESAVTPAPKAAAYMEGAEGDAGLWIRYSRKRKTQERGSPEAEEEEGCGKGETETEAEKGDDVGPAIGCLPPRRICSDCGASQTPLWRRGPAGPKSLCNACGIRYRKAKRRAGRDSPNIAAPAPAPGAAGGDGQKGDLRASLDMSVSSQLTAGAEEAKRKQREGRLERRQEVLWRLLEESTKLELPCGKEAVEAAVLLMAMSSGLFVSSC